MIRYGFITPWTWPRWRYTRPSCLRDPLFRPIVCSQPMIVVSDAPSGSVQILAVSLQYFRSASRVQLGQDRSVRVHHCRPYLLNSSPIARLWVMSSLLGNKQCLHDAPVQRSCAAREVLGDLRSSLFTSTLAKWQRQVLHLMVLVPLAFNEVFCFKRVCLLLLRDP